MTDCIVNVNQIMIRKFTGSIKNMMREFHNGIVTIAIINSIVTNIINYTTHTANTLIISANVSSLGRFELTRVIMPRSSSTLNIGSVRS